MGEITVTARGGDPTETSADTRVVGVFEGDVPEHATLAKMVESGELKPGYKKVCVAHAHGARIVAVGLGKRDEFTPERARVAAAVAQGRAAEIGARSLSWLLPDQAPAGGTAADIAEAIVEGTLLKAYKFDRYKSKGDGKGDGDGDGDGDGADGSGTEGGANGNGGLLSLEIASDEPLDQAVETARVTAEAVNRARDLQNLPSNVATPTYLSDRASGIVAEADGVTFRIHDRAAIERMGMEAFAAVARGTAEPPFLIELRYQGEGATGPRIGFVGKAVTFDTGGISIKPAGKMHEMKFDMSGGAAVLEAVSAIARLRLPVDITAIIPATENMPSGTATKPGDIVTAMNGKTIEINNTDAEGRLVLADALAYAVESGVERIVDLATLTGAIIVALGSTYAGHFANDDEWYGKIQAASDATGELGHRLPLHPEYLELTKGRYADLTNASESRKASSIYAAEFLRQFVNDVPWVHLDIAGTAWDLGREYVGKGASGFGVRTLVRLARDLADAA